jgi:hypothetical protein
MADWVRCGNTPYYRSGKGYGWFFVDPFNWRMLSTSLEKVGGLDYILAIYTEAPRYDWPMLKEGVRFIERDVEKQKEILKITHEWAFDLVNMGKLFKKNSITPTMKSAFEEANESDREAVFQGVRSLIQGFSAEDLKHFLEKEQIQSRTIIAIDASNGATPDEIRNIESDYPNLDNTLLANNIEEAFERALSDFDIFEC